MQSARWCSSDWFWQLQVSYIVEWMFFKLGSTNPACLRLWYSISTRLWAVLPTRQVALLWGCEETHQLLTEFTTMCSVIVHLINWCNNLIVPFHDCSTLEFECPLICTFYILFLFKIWCSIFTHIVFCEYYFPWKIAN